MSVGERMPLERARKIAEAFAEQLAGSVDRTVIAGSVRRRCASVGDIEIVALPKVRREPAPGQGRLFGEPLEVEVSLPHEAITALGPDLALPVKPGTKPPLDGVSWAPDDRWEEKRTAGPRYLRLWLPRTAARVDLFLATPETWGAILAIRTGSAYFSAALMRRWTDVSGGGTFFDGRLYPPAETSGPPYPLDTPEEKDVFKACRIEWVEPEYRLGPRSIFPYNG